MTHDTSAPFISTKKSSILQYRLRRLWRRKAVRKSVTVIIPACLFCIGLLIMLRELDASSRMQAWLLEANNRIINRTEFSLKAIDVRGRERAPLEDIRAAALHGRTQISSFDFDPHKLKQDIEAIPWVRAAQVSMVHPDIILIVLDEYTPAALWSHQNRLWLLDPGGQKIKAVESPTPWSDLPLVLGAEAPDALNTFLSNISYAGNLINYIKAYVHVGGRRWSFVLRNQTVIDMPEHYFGIALERLISYQESHRILERNVERIDLRSPTEMVVHLSDDIVQRLAVE